MRAIRLTMLFVAAAMLAAVPAIGVGGGGNDPIIPKGDFNVSPDQIPANTPSAIDVNGGSCRAGDVVPTNVRVQLHVGTPDGPPAPPPNGWDLDNDNISGTWGDTLNLSGLDAGLYWFIAACQHLDLPDVEDCTEDLGEAATPNVGPGCYNPQPLNVVVEAAEPAAAEEREPTFAG